MHVCLTRAINSTDVNFAVEVRKHGEDLQDMYYAASRKCFDVPLSKCLPLTELDDYMCKAVEHAKLYKDRRTHARVSLEAPPPLELSSLSEEEIAQLVLGEFGQEVDIQDAKISNRYPALQVDWRFRAYDPRRYVLLFMFFHEREPTPVEMLNAIGGRVYLDIRLDYFHNGTRTFGTPKEISKPIVLNGNPAFNSLYDALKKAGVYKTVLKMLGRH